MQATWCVLAVCGAVIEIVRHRIQMAWSELFSFVEYRKEDDFFALFCISISIEEWNCGPSERPKWITESSVKPSLVVFVGNWPEIDGKKNISEKCRFELCVRVWSESRSATVVHECECRCISFECDNSFLLFLFNNMWTEQWKIEENNKKRRIFNVNSIKQTKRNEK